MIDIVGGTAGRDGDVDAADSVTTAPCSDPVADPAPDNFRASADELTGDRHDNDQSTQVGSDATTSGLRARRGGNADEKQGTPTVAPAVLPANRTWTALFAVFLFATSLFISEGIVMAWVAGIVWTRSAVLTVPFVGYAVWMIWDRRTCSTCGTLRLSWVRTAPFWATVASYFPAQLVDATEGGLDPNENYIIGQSPHGFLAYGAFFNIMLPNATGFGRTFPGIHVRVATIPFNFMIPFWRELLHGYGAISATYGSCLAWLNRGKNTVPDRVASDRGKALLIILGGAEEATYSSPGTLDLVLRKRMGFVKLALQTGSPMVPALTFGENDIYTTVPAPPGSRMRAAHDWFMRVFGFSVPIVHGRFLWLLPNARPLVTVIGPPIVVPKPAPGTLPVADRADVAHWHGVYVDALQRLYDKYKDVYAKDRVRDMRLVA